MVLVIELGRKLFEQFTRTSYVRKNIFEGFGLDSFGAGLAHGNILYNVIISITVGNFCCGYLRLAKWSVNKYKMVIGQVVLGRS